MGNHWNFPTILKSRILWFLIKDVWNIPTISTLTMKGTEYWENGLNSFVLQTQKNLGIIGIFQ